MATKTPAEAIAEQMEQSELLKALFSGTTSPFLHHHHQLLRHIDRVFDDVTRVCSEWKRDFLDKADATTPELDTYARPIIVTAELIRRHRPLLMLAQLLYEKCIQLVDAHCATHKVDLHRGAFYANLAITFLQQGRYKAALPWLHAAAKQDQDHRPDVKTIYDSYAFSAEGIFGQWLDIYVLDHLPPDVVTFVNGTLGTHYTTKDVKQLITWLAGRGDLHVISGVLDYCEFDGKDDFHADSVRLSAVRDLATLFEVTLKHIGVAHNDATVVAAFADPPTLAALICHMHFHSGLKQRRNNTALNANRAPGIFHNTLLPDNAILEAIDAGIDYCAGTAHSVADVWKYLQANILSTAPFADALAKRFLLAYKLRNTTSHGFAPSDPAMKVNYDSFRLWLLQAVCGLYFWAKGNGYAAL